MSYIWQYIHTRSVEFAFSSHTVEHPDHGETWNMTDSDIYIEYDLQHQSNKISDKSNPSEANQLLTAIHKDYFFYMYRQFMAVAKRDGKIDGMYGWKELAFPEYYVIKAKHGYLVLRYN